MQTNSCACIQWRPNAPSQPGTEVRVVGLHDAYVPLLLELDRRWEVVPFAYDWRLPLQDTADQLERLVASGFGED